MKGSSPFPSIGPLIIHATGVEKQLRQLNPSKASGPDEIPPRLLKLVAHEIAPALSFVFQQSYESGVVPAQWKQALVSPVHKSGDKSDPTNYRPISLTCICGKVMEHIMLSHISKHLAVHNILADSQHGFRQGLSTTTQLTSVIHEWSSCLQKRSQTDAVFLDFQKAFDRVPHHRLFSKLQYYGITGDSLMWIKSFLADRQQAVVVNGAKSSWKEVTSGVPQGSVIGPTLFLIFINDIKDNLKSPIRLFADDCVIYREILSELDHQILQEDLQKLSSWAETWLMTFNIKKCAVVSITRKRHPNTYQYYLCSEEIPRSNEYKYLGITITADLRWNRHCQTIRQNASKTLGLIRRTLHPCSREVKAQAYSSLVRPKLEYGSQAWNPCTHSNINNLEQVQKAAARFVMCDYKRSTSSTHLISQLGWDSLHTRRLLDQCALFFKIHHHLASMPLPPGINLATYHGRHDHALKYSVPKATVDVYKYSFYPRTIWIWNHLPSQVVLCTGLTSFKEAALPSLRTMQPPVLSSLL